MPIIRLVDPNYSGHLLNEHLQLKTFANKLGGAPSLLCSPFSPNAAVHSSVDTPVANEFYNSSRSL